MSPSEASTSSRGLGQFGRELRPVWCVAAMAVATWLAGSSVSGQNCTYTSCPGSQQCCNGTCYDPNQQCCTQTGVKPKYDKMTPPTGTLQSVYGHEWAHCQDTTEHIDLEVAGAVDWDRVNCNEISAFKEIRWHGGQKGYCLPESSIRYTRWFATERGQSTVTATLVDDDTYPETDEPDVVLTYSQVNGFMVYVEVNANGHLYLPEAVLVWEKELPRQIDWTIGPQSQTSASVRQGTPQTVQRERFCHTQFDFKADPPQAQPRRNIQMEVLLEPVAIWVWELGDYDLVDLGSDQLGLSVNLLPGGAATFEYTWDVTDGFEACFCGDWAFAATGGVIQDRNPSGSRPGSGALVWDQSNLYPGTMSYHGDAKTFTLGRSGGSGAISRQKGQTIDATYTISAGATRKAPDSDDYTFCRFGVGFEGGYMVVWTVRY